MSYEDDVEFFEFAENFVADQIKFINLILEEVRKRDKRCQAVLGNSYGKAIGFLTPFKEATIPLKKVRTELGLYLDTTRLALKEEYENQFRSSKKRKEKNTGSFPPESPIRV